LSRDEHVRIIGAMQNDREQQPARAQRLSPTQREQIILDTAARLFYARGIRGVGMDELVQETGLSKMSVYRVFPTKDLLVGAYLRRTSAAVLAMIDAAIAAHADDPRAALRAMFDLVEADTGRADFRGAAFQNASVEFHEHDHPARVATREHEQAVYARLFMLTDQLRPGDGERLAAWLHILITGMYGDAAILGVTGPAAHGRALAERLIAEASAAG
jgi:AcrR family transcriptional regulator